MGASVRRLKYGSHPIFDLIGVIDHVEYHETDIIDLSPCDLFAATPASAQDVPAPVCDVAIYEELSELADARAAVDLARSDFAAYEKIFDMIKGLWDAKTIPGHGLHEGQI